MLASECLLPVGFHLIKPLKRPISSSSVHGSASRSSSALLGEGAAGVSWEMAGDVACDVRAFFRGGMMNMCTKTDVLCSRNGHESACM